MKDNNSANCRKSVISELNNAFKGILYNHKYLNKLIKQGEEVIGCGAWLLDNIYLIEKEYKAIKFNLPESYFDNLPISNNDECVPRIYELAKKYVNDNRCIIKEEEIINFIKGKSINFTIGELWAFPLMIRIALIIELAKTTSDMVVLQKQRAGARDFADVVVNAYNHGKLDKLMTKLQTEYPLHVKVEEEVKDNKYLGDSKILHDGLFSAEFIEKFFRILKDNSIEDERIYNFVLERSDGGNDVTLDEKIKREHIQEGIIETYLGSTITSLRIIDSINWKNYFNNTSKVEHLLNKDPMKTYSNMDFKTKDYYRHKVERLARIVNVSEEEIVARVLELSNRYLNNERELFKSHVGYYLIDDGVNELLKSFSIKEKITNKMSTGRFIGTITSITLLSSLGVLILMYLIGVNFNVAQYIIAFLIMIIPASEITIALFNWNTSKVVSPAYIPKMDYSKGIPKQEQTIVVIPTLLSSVKRTKELIEHLELYYLANKDENIYFALLGDFKDSKNEKEEKDEEINNVALEEVEKLNKKYFNNKNEHFFFLNRKRLFNKKEKIYMGYERKRGKLMEFMALLKGEKNTTYNVISSGFEHLKPAKYIITLDSDTILPLGVAKKMIEAMGHILNRPYKENGRVVRGYGIMQPKVGVNLEDKHKTYFSKIFAGEAGVDGYSIASSDTYQDLFGEGIFTGKGILEIDTFYNTLKDEIPDNTILSHDLLEGSYARCALLTDVEVIDGYPSYYASSCQRLHRWVRGDWQTLPWLFSSKLSALSRWKIFDNLRRSLLAPSLLIGLMLTLTALRGAGQVTILLFLAVIIPLVFTVTDFVVTPKNRLMGTFKSFKQIVLILSFIPYQAYLMLDAIIRTLFRLTISRKSLLQWQTAEDAEKSVVNTLGGYYKRMWISPVVSILILVFLLRNSSLIAATNLVLVVLWFIAPVLAYKISTVDKEERDYIEEDDLEFLRGASRRIWAYYEDFVNEENNYLAPDNYQEKPFKGVAHRTSPTNIGMGLITNLIAYDLGYLTMGDVLNRLELILEGMNGLEKYHGHYLNWYDTKTQMPLWPRYISTVDSGNLLGYLWIIKDMLEGFGDKPLIRINEVLAIRDTYKLISKDDGLELENNLPDEIEINEYRELLQSEILRVKELFNNIKKDNKEESNKGYWLNKAKDELEFKIDFYDYIFDGIEEILSDKLGEEKNLTLNGLLEFLRSIKSLADENKRNVVGKKLNHLEEFNLRIKKASETIKSIMDEMDFKVLYVKERGLFSIGYNLEENSLGSSYYDLMASEARATSFLAIARGEVPKEHWYNLSRNMTKAFGNKSLVSWSGTMFEYFMPYQIMKNFDKTLLDLTYSSVIKSQRDYAEKKGVPWGISESAFYEFDIDKNYQYRAFGVPGVGLKRGLEDELVVSPYSTLMALPYDREASISNLKRLEKIGATGRYGYIEAIDYTKSRVKTDGEDEEVRCYMVHHLGMSLMALDNVLNENILQERFHNIPEIKAVEILLKEKIPQNITFEREVDINTHKVTVEREKFIPRIIDGWKRENPEVLLLSNGSYSTMITQTGSGYSKKDDMTVYRWKGDSTSDSTGMFFYIKNVESNKYWSATYEPCKVEASDYKVEFTLDSGIFKRIDEKIETTSEVIISAEDDVEIRKLTIKNLGEGEALIDITSYLEVTLQSFEGDAVHPSFSNLFISTEYDEASQSLIGNRRARAKGGKTPHIIHTLLVNGEEKPSISYDTSRISFIGRDRDLKSPKAMDKGESLENTIGIVLDPIMSLRTRIKVNGGEEREVYYITAVGDSKSEVLALADRYKAINKIQSSIESYNHSSQLELKYMGIKSAQANLYQKLSSYILFLHSGRRDREDYIKNINMNQENLWAYGISGDLPIVMLLIKNDDDIDLLRQIINMHYYWRIKGIKADLVIYNEEEVSYDEPLQKSIGESIRNSLSRDYLNKPGGIFIHNKSTMGEDVKNFLVGIAKFYIDSSNGTLINQIKETEVREEISYIRHKELSGAKLGRTINYGDEKIFDHKDKMLKYDSKKNTSEKSRHNERSNRDFEKEKLDFFNGYGGFRESDNSYVIRLDNYESTPAPWINVISNEDFGFHISEVGSSYTWCGNSRENKITPWSNDWVMDPVGEAFYVRDNSTGDYFSITPKPVRDDGEYIIEHSFGYSTFKHTAYDIRGELKAFCPKKEKVKLYKVSLENLSSEEKELSLFYYAQLVLGVHSYSNAKNISTYIENDYIWGQNPYSKYFGMLKAYLSIQGGEGQSFTGDRKEFIGIGEDLAHPYALKLDSFSNNSGGVLDPCLASMTKIKLSPGEKKDIVVLLGQEENKELIKEKVEKYKNIKEVDKALDNVKAYWSNFLGNIQVKTPDKSMDYLLNGWLMYQTLGCRYLSRTAFYQSGGAYGFRDQLQDSMSIGMLNSKVTRDQILRSASRQYIEGDVQHWWHPVVNSGIRTRFSDDLLWLPYVVIEYINLTGDYGVLSEKVPYLEDSPLNPGEDERYTIVNNVTKEESIYMHCIRAIERGLKFGQHNIPLMGSGDWNDGMSTVGNEGRGESVWLGWFLYKILDGFNEICDYMKDDEKKKRYIKFQEFIRENLEENAWDGDWYRRAYFDDGTPLGSRVNDECKIDSLAQSWSIISGAGDKAREKEAMASVDKYLVDKDKGIIKLLSPPFDKSNLEPGYIKGYVAGVRENGGQYTHAAVWVILALTKLGLEDKAVKYYNMINPINHSSTEISARNYKVEPYVMAADVYLKDPHGGRGGWSWYTGASGWMYKVGIENIIGLKIVNGKGYKIEPCIPEDWNEYEIKINNEKEKYNIRVIRGKEKGITINGKKIEGDMIPKDSGELEIVVII
ncbi:GH36-type glycosyl hydrolase domain-containing protein [Clostridium sp.]|uniref:GH36-type glycosyl hydrolase domain-containing protein n=1 Tax=Clostridium sp. TaxID=1506 RepID=UPI003F31E12C